MLKWRGRKHPFIVAIVAALVFSQLPTLAWAQQPKLPQGWMQDAARRYAVVVDAKAGTVTLSLAQDEQPAGWSTKKKVLLGVGIGVAGVGALMLAAGPSMEERRDRGDTGWVINWKATGAAWLGIGAGLAIWGLVTK
jgi:hypothetical protein